MNDKNKKAELEKAAKALEADRKERGEKAQKALEAWAKEFNASLIQVVKIGDKTAPIQNILALPIGIEIQVN